MTPKEAYLLYGKLAERLGDLDTARLAYQEVIQTKNPPPDVFATLALLLLKLNQPGEAKQVCQQGLALYPNQCLILNSLGRVHEWSKEIDLAEGIYRDSVVDDPSCQSGWENLGLLQMNYRSFPEAIETFRSALESPAPSPYHHLNLGIAYMQQRKDTALAREHFQQFTELMPEQAHLIPENYRKER